MPIEWGLERIQWKLRWILLDIYGIIPVEIIPAEIIPAEIIPAEIIPAEIIPVEIIPAEIIPAEIIEKPRHHTLKKIL